MKIKADVLVIGGGQAALRSAIEAREQGASVIIATKGKAGGGGSSVISDGVHSAIFSKGDSPHSFFEDIMRGGKGINHAGLARILAIVHDHTKGLFIRWNLTTTGKNNYSSGK